MKGNFRRRPAAFEKAAPLLLALALLLGSCGGAPPELLAVDARLDLRPSRQGSYESLSVFASIRDSDGLDDVESLAVMNDKAELAWTLDSSNWTIRKEGSDNWLGAADLAMPDYSPLPRGEYRLVATSLSGQKAEKAFRLDAPAEVARLPVLSLDPGSAGISSSFPETYLLAYDGGGSLLAVKEVKNGQASLATLFGSATDPRIRYLTAYCYDPQARIGAFSWRMTRK